jgi:hypothetical protein
VASIRKSKTIECDDLASEIRQLTEQLKEAVSISTRPNLLGTQSPSVSEGVCVIRSQEQDYRVR